MTDAVRKELLKNQQGELDGVLMYNALAKAVKNPKDAEAFKQLAKEEGRHAAVFKSYTNTPLKARKALAWGLPLLYYVLGRKNLYRIIAQVEYNGEKNYERLVADFPEVESVKNDERRHGDIVSGLLK